MREQCKAVQLGGFCKLLGRRLGSVCIRLKIIDGQLHHLFDAEKADQMVLRTQSVSLSEILKCRIPSKAKILLAYILAKSVWQYYDSDFMKAPWTTDSVHFMREGKRGNGSQEEIDPARPCFAFRPSMSEQFESAEYCDSFSVLHRYPRVLALAALLIDICQKTTDEIKETTSIEERINNDFTRCSDIVESNCWPDLDLKNQDAIQIYRNAVRKCLDPKLFHIPTSIDGSGNMAIKTRRNALYTYVVLPLTTLCANLGIIDNVNDIGRLTFSEPHVESSYSPAPALLASMDKKM